ncbi:hypothetical protein ACPL_4142 [Actinoplanes sp. SE50/110]|nr:hypothetical protein ACPL_4142 [Actinoplanes sp. SE50/110]SLM00835.1 hypothetical protein ACSP50_4068 [Actinoplanes sp. SE50/110]
MNEMARSTDPLPPTGVLHLAHRRRTRRRLAVVTAAAAAVLAVPVAITVLGPDHRADRPAAGTALPGDARQALRDSVTALAAGDYTFTRSGASDVADIRQGVVHLPDSVLIEHSDTFAMARVGPHFYLKYLLDANPELRAQLLGYYRKHLSGAQLRSVEQSYARLDGEHWVAADEKKLIAAAAIEEQSGLDSMARLPDARRPDATGAGTLIAAVTSAQRSGTVITGTLDATGKDPELQKLFNDPTYLYGVGAKAMPYRAVLDDQGRLTEFTVSMPDQRMASQPAEPITPQPPLVIRISRYGQTGVQPAPATSGEVTAQDYELLSTDTD